MNGRVIQNFTITNRCNVGIHRQNNDGVSTVNASVFGNGITAPVASFLLAALFADNGGTATDAGTMNLVVGSAGNGAQQNTLAGGATVVVDVSLSNFDSGTHFNLSKNGSMSGTVGGMIADDNIGSPSAYTTSGSGPIMLLSTPPPTR